MCNVSLVRGLSIFALGSLLAGAALYAGCVGDNPADITPTPEADGAAPCTGPGCTNPDGGGPDSPAGDSSPTDGGGDAGPPACTKIQVTTLAGSVEGNTNGPGATAKFNSPEGITVDPGTGTLFVADTGNQLVRKVLADGTTSTYSTLVSFGGSSTGAWINPRHVLFSEYYSGLFISDHGHDQVFKVVGAAGGNGTSDFALGSLQAFAIQPVTHRKFVVSSSRVAQRTPADPGIEATVFSGTFASGFVDGAGADARYANLLDLAFDGETNLYVADQGNHRIRKVIVTAGATYGDVTTFAGSATAGHVDGTGAAAQFEGPYAFAIDQVTHLNYVADGATIRVVDPTGKVTTLVGSNAAYVDGDGCTAKFINVKGIVKFANELYVLDVNRIRKIVLN